MPDKTCDNEKQEYAPFHHVHAQYALTTHTHPEYALTTHTHVQTDVKDILNNTVVLIPDAIRGSVGTPIAGGDVRNLDLDLSSAPLYNAQDEIENGKFYFKFPYKGIYCLECDVDWSLFTPSLAGKVTGIFALKRWTPTPVEEVTKYVWEAGETELGIPPTIDSGIQPKNLRVIYTITDDPADHIVEPLFVITVGVAYAIGFKNIRLRLLELWE